MYLFECLERELGELLEGDDGAVEGLLDGADEDADDGDELLDGDSDGPSLDGEEGEVLEELGGAELDGDGDELWFL